MEDEIAFGRKHTVARLHRNHWLVTPTEEGDRRIDAGSLCEAVGSEDGYSNAGLVQTATEGGVVGFNACQCAVIEPRR